MSHRIQPHVMWPWILTFAHGRQLKFVRGDGRNCSPARLTHLFSRAPRCKKPVSRDPSLSVDDAGGRRRPIWACQARCASATAVASTMSRPIGFSFDGRRYQGLAGDTLASALIANGVHLMGRSFKYHRPRGPISIGSEEPNALVTIDAGKGRVTPNLRATQIEIYEGLRAQIAERLALARARRARRSTARCRRFFPPASTTRRSSGRPAPGSTSTSRRSAAPPASASRRPIRTPTITPTSTAIARSRSSAPARRASPPLARRRAPASASCCSTSSPNSAARCSPTRMRRSTASRRRNGSPTSSRSYPRLPNVTLLPRTQVFGYYAQNFLAAEERVTDHLAYPDHRLPARAFLAGPGQAGDRRDRRARAPAGVPRQRPPRHHARQFGARARHPLRREAGKPHRRRHHARRRLSRRARSRRRRLRDRHDRR